MSNNVTITDDTLVVEPSTVDKLLSFKGKLVVPLAHVKGATHDPGMKGEPKGLRAPGIRIPGKIAGTFHADGGRQFWNVDAYDRAVVIELDSEPYDRLILTVPEPTAVVDQINAALHR